MQRHRATYNRKGGVRHFLAAYDLETDRLVGVFRKRKTWAEFLGFLKWLRYRYPSGQVLHVVLDNYSPHLKEEVGLWAFGHNVRFYFTPSQTSWLNRIESQFTALKEFALNNSDYRSHEEQIEAIEAIQKEIPAGDLPDMIRYLMMRGIETITAERAKRTASKAKA